MHPVRTLPLALSVFALACGADADRPAPKVEPGTCTDAAMVSLERAWSSDESADCFYATLLRYDAREGPRVIASNGHGQVSALDPSTGETLWTVELPAAEAEVAQLIATPAAFGASSLVIAWQDTTSEDVRRAHRLAVIDLAAGRLDARYPVLELAATKPSFDGKTTVRFRPDAALSRSRLVHAQGRDGADGYVYVSFGNKRDLQPFHGWLFEIDLTAWREQGTSAAIHSVLLTTPDTDCGADGTSGAREMACGGGIWAPTGPELVTEPDGSFELLVPTGNGLLDLPRKSYSHTLMRLRGPGLEFDDGCDRALCADWEIAEPSRACMASCGDLFVPRLLPAEAPLASPTCRGLSFFDCYAALDWDLGANSPAVVTLPNGPRVLLLPAKDGAVYLVDYEHLGTLYDRLQLVVPCGSDGADCKADWAGMMVTRPTLTERDGEVLALVPTFNFDDENAAGLIAVRIALRDGRPTLEKLWQAPTAEREDALRTFRTHPSGVRVLAEGRFAAVVDQEGPSKHGELLIVRLADGAIVAEAKLEERGQRFAEPLAIDDRIFVASCTDANDGRGHVEAWQLRCATPKP